MLKKRSSSVAYHFVREGVAKREWITGYVNTSVNPSDIMTKMELNREERRRKIRMIFYDI